MSYIVGLLASLISKEAVFSFIKGLILDVLAEPLYDAACEVLDEAVARTDTKIDDEIAANLKEYLAEKLDV